MLLGLANINDESQIMVAIWSHAQRCAILIPPPFGYYYKGYPYATEQF